MTRIAFMPGDGIGREVLPVARDVLKAAGFRADWVDLAVGWDEWTRHGDALPATTLEAMRSTRCALFGAITSKDETEAQAELPPRLRSRGLAYESPVLRLRRTFNLAVNLRPVQGLRGLSGPGREPPDLVLFRENTEDLYAGIEAHPTSPDLLAAWQRAGIPQERLPAPGDGTALSLRVVTRGRTEALCRAAFDYARTNGRRRVTLLEKANVLRKTGGFVRTVFHETAESFPDLAADDLQIDAACAQVVRNPARFDVVVATNLFGDIFSDLAAELGGGLGLAPSANLGPAYALFEPVHGSAPDIAGRGIANPLGAVRTGALLARHVGQEAVARAVEASVRAWAAEGGPRTPDLGGRATTRDVSDWLVDRLGSMGRRGVPAASGS